MYDIVFLGSGHSCWHGALALAAAGKKVAIVDGDLPGGTCTNYGCDAKIILDGPFEFVEGLERYRDLCVEGNGKIDWRKLMAYKRQVLEPFPQALPAMFQAYGIEFVPEFGRLVDAHTVQAGERTLETAYVVIGTGQRDSVLDIPGKELMHNSREFQPGSHELH
ncbi:MAG: NAD(P)/FAD-dependent oxidoreductase [Atopobiaceae bacterium]|nr:NAD(P)/FAD-dependent oxidoreductase [Atopobiaceae bacterium]